MLNSVNAPFFETLLVDQVGVISKLCENRLATSKVTTTSQLKTGPNSVGPTAHVTLNLHIIDMISKLKGGWAKTDFSKKKLHQFTLY